MRAYDSPYLADWFVISLRWVALLGLVISLALGGALLTPSNLLLAGLVVWNIALAVLAVLNRRLQYHRQVSLAVDILLTAIFFWLQGGPAGPAFWAPVIPLFSASLYFDLRGALITALILALLETGLTVLPPGRQALLLPAVVISAGTLLLGVGLGVISQGATRGLRQAREETLEQQRRKQRVDNERLHAIYNLTSTLTGTLNYQRVLDSVLDLSLSALSSEQDTQPLTRLVSAVLLFSEENVLEVGSARRFTPADSRVELAGEQGAIAGAMESGEPLLVDEPSIDPELSRIVAFHSCGQVYVFPLRSGFNIYGVLLFGHPDAGFMTRDRQEVLDILGRQAVIAIANARLYQQLVDERDRMVEVQEEARKKLARDLHDGPTQSVSAIAMRVNLARRMIENDPREAGQELGKVEELARRTTKEIRHMLFTLRPLVLESQGLLAALNAMAEKMKETYSQGLNIQVNPQELEQLEIGRQGVIFFIVEEAVNNARKHAQAPHIWVRLRSLDKSMLLLEVQDDGIGFDVEAVNRSYDKRGSLGMINLRERTELINGVLNIQSTPGKGTTVRVAIPLTEEAADRLHQSAARR